MNRRKPEGLRGCSDRSCSGFTLLEVMAGMIFVTLALMGLGALFVSSQRSYETAMEEAAASHSFRLMAERMRGTPFSEVAAKYQGYVFTVGQIQGTGTVTIILDETATTADAQELGLPRDLDGDGVASSTDVSASYLLLPVVIEIVWDNTHGRQNKKLHFCLSQEG